MDFPAEMQSAAAAVPLPPNGRFYRRSLFILFADNHQTVNINGILIFFTAAIKFAGEFYPQEKVINPVFIVDCHAVAYVFLNAP